MLKIPPAGAQPILQKLVVVPVEPVESWSHELDDLADAVLELQHK